MLPAASPAILLFTQTNGSTVIEVSLQPLVADAHAAAQAAWLRAFSHCLSGLGLIICV